jgi:AraC-like DNA-binding protein
MEVFPLSYDETHKEKNVLVFHRQVGRFSVPWHSHMRDQLVYAENGVLHLHTEQLQVLLPARHGAWIPYDFPHKIYSSSPDLFLRVLYFKHRKTKHVGMKHVQVFPISNLAQEMIIYSENWDNNADPDPLEKSFADTLYLLLPSWTANALHLVLPTTEDPQLRKITDYIRENLEEPLRLEEVAKKSGFTGRTLLRLFKKKFGITFGTYLKIARIISAIELLSVHGASVAEVSYAVGYENPSSFSNTFHQLVGIRPKEYINGCQKR